MGILSSRRCEWMVGQSGMFYIYGCANAERVGAKHMDLEGRNPTSTVNGCRQSTLAQEGSCLQQVRHWVSKATLRNTVTLSR